MIQQRSAGIIIFGVKNGVRHYLLLHYVGGHWDFAKGKVEQGETDTQAALRELDEETGLSAEIIPGFQATLSYLFFNQSGERIRKCVIFFVGTAIGEDVVLSREHKGYEWLEYDQAMKKVTFDNARKVLEKAEKFLAQAKSY